MVAQIAEAVENGKGMEIPIPWVLGIIGTLGGVIAALASIIYKSLEKRIDSQNRIIATQSQSIQRLQEDIGRLSRGCGMNDCLWRHHGHLPIVSNVNEG